MKTYLAWLDRYDVTRPHRTGRWRVRKADTQTTDPWIAGMLLGRPLTAKEAGYLARWGKSDEFRHKSNAAALLHLAKYRHRQDGAGARQTDRVKTLCRHIRSAMIAFAGGDGATGKAAMQLAWAEYMMLMTIANAPATLRGAMIPAQARAAQAASADVKRTKNKPLAFYFAAAVKTLGAVPGHVALCQATLVEIERTLTAHSVARDQIDAMKKRVTKRSATAWLNVNHPDRPTRGTLARKRTKTQENQ